MKTREQITAELLQQNSIECEKNAKKDYYKDLAEEQGQAAVDKLIAEREGYSTVITAELEKRLTEETYLTCEDFDHFDVNCCDTCHTCYPHYEMWVVVLSDGRNAWVCDSIRGILTRETKVEDALHEASLAVTSDEERLYYCLQYAHHTYKRKRGHETVESLVSLALSLPGRGPAQSSKLA